VYTVRPLGFIKNGNAVNPRVSMIVGTYSGKTSKLATYDVAPSSIEIHARRVVT